ncbi:MAG: DMT family transporter [Pseudomonadota bacterium]|nr:DMT family transporter [Pseudomonadota bacterium]
MLGALGSFLMMAVGGRELSDTMNTFQIMLVRSLVGIAIILTIIILRGGNFERTQRLKIHFSRNIVHYSAQVGWFFGVSMLPLATVCAIEFTTPIWVALMATLFLRENLTRGRVVALVFGFGGVVIILRPDSDMFNIASLAVLWAAIGFASAYIFTKMLSETDEPLTILIYMTVMQTLIGLTPGIIVWVPVGMEDIVWILFCGIAGLSSHYCLAKALSYADALVVIPIDFLRLPLFAFVGFILYGEALEIMVICGAVIIFSGNYYNMRTEASVKETQ